MVDAQKHIKEIKKRANGFSICRCLDFWGENMLYYGLYHNHIYTDGYSTLKSLIQEYPELKNAIQ